MAESAIPPAAQPAIVRTAIKWLYRSLALGALSLLVNWLFFAKFRSAGFLIDTVLGLGLSAWLISRMNAGRNWARIIWLILFALSLPFDIWAILKWFVNVSLIAGTLSLAQFIIQAAGFVMLLSEEANAWFGPVKVRFWDDLIHRNDHQA